MAEEVKIEKVPILGKESIYVGYDLWGSFIANDLLENVRAGTYVLVTDDHLYPLYVPQFEKAFASSASILKKDAHLHTLRVPPGESSKSRAMKAHIEDWMLHKDLDPPCDTKTVIIALGGGVIGDLLGYVAATFKRGIRFVQVPTSLLAMVDSSIGGKTAIDTPAGKNLIGAFWQPTRIYADLSFLDTLPTRQFVNGMAEVIKTAAIWNEKAFETLELNASTIMPAVHGIVRHGKRDLSSVRAIIREAVLSSIRVKAQVVTADEREGGLRNLLNFGHSIGHAIECILAPQILHGECVAIGMHLEALLARHLRVLNDSAVARLSKCLTAHELPISLSDKRIKQLSGGKHCPVDDLLRIMGVDKKNEGRQKRVVLLGGIGRTHERKASAVDDADIRIILSNAIRVSPGIRPGLSVSCTPPGSKSISNRALVLAALSDGTCRLRNLLHSDDTEVMMKALTELKAASFSWEDDGQVLVVKGHGGQLKTHDQALYLGNAGTASRFLTSVAVLAKPHERDHSILTGNARMKQRPIGPLVDALRSNEATISYMRQVDTSEYVEKTTSEQKEKFGACLPLKIKATGGMEGGDIELDAKESSQYVSSILMCAPRAKRPVTLRMVGGPPISQPYIDMTTAMMASFGVKVTKSDTEEHTYHIPRATYQSPPDYIIESDASSATYPLALAAISGTTCTVPNIGSASLQGDAQFAVKILGPMGCAVHQTASATTVTGPARGKLKPLPEMDMTTMTDAFLTASMLAAVARDANKPPRTRIIGIANQQKKECERISAIRDELAHFGVKASLWPKDHPIPDGIEIDGSPIDDLAEPTSGVHCYDDHRVAMSFSVLAAATSQGAVIREKDCVGKTWPGWWDAMRNTFGIRLAGVELATHTSTSKPNPPSSIFMIGMRGAGKTTAGRWASDMLDWPFFDLDSQLEKQESRSIPETINAVGWEGFRERETKLLQSMIQQSSKPRVIACGGGIVETPEGRQRLIDYHAAGGAVILIERNFEDVNAFLQIDKTRPAYTEDVRKVWERRQYWYKQCSNYEYLGSTGSTFSPQDIPNDFERLLSKITKSPGEDSPLLHKSPSFFLSLTLPEIPKEPGRLQRTMEDVDAVELRVDLLTQPEQQGDFLSVEFAAEQLASCRRTTTLPIIFTVRTESEGGRFPINSQGGEQAITELFNMALRSGVEYLDVEIQLPASVLDFVKKNKRTTKIIASRHDTTGSLSWARDWSYEFEKAVQIGDIVKLVGVAKSQEDNFQLQTFREWARHQSKLPLIALNMGRRGQLSRILNPQLTPVTHDLLQIKAAPGQLSAADIRRALSYHGVLDAKKFFLFGKPIARSPSPGLHNFLFNKWGFPHTYSLHESDSTHTLTPILSSSDFGGASVTIPLKVDIIPLLDAVTTEAQIIGAVNTIVPSPTRSSDKNPGGPYLTGHNTDWQGIKLVLQHAGVPSSLSSDGPRAGMVIGTGGTARAAIYALHALGCRPIYIVGRSSRNTSALISSFPQDYALLAISLPPPEQQGPAVGVMVSTIPGDAPLDAGVRDVVVKILRERYVGVETARRVCVEMAYHPEVTPLVQLIGQHAPRGHAEGEPGAWEIIPGRAVLAGQAIFQSELWTGCRAGLEEAMARVEQIKASQQSEFGLFR